MTTSAATSPFDLANSKPVAKANVPPGCTQESLAYVLEYVLGMPPNSILAQALASLGIKTFLDLTTLRPADVNALTYPRSQVPDDFGNLQPDEIAPVPQDLCNIMHGFMGYICHCDSAQDNQLTVYNCMDIDVDDFEDNFCSGILFTYWDCTETFPKVDDTTKQQPTKKYVHGISKTATSVKVMSIFSGSSPPSPVPQVHAPSNGPVKISSFTQFLDLSMGSTLDLDAQYPELDVPSQVGIHSEDESFVLVTPSSHGECPGNFFGSPDPAPDPVLLSAASCNKLSLNGHVIKPQAKCKFKTDWRHFKRQKFKRSARNPQPRAQFESLTHSFCYLTNPSFAIQSFAKKGEQIYRLATWLPKLVIQGIPWGNYQLRSYVNLHPIWGVTE